MIFYFQRQTCKLIDIEPISLWFARRHFANSEDESDASSDIVEIEDEDEQEQKEPQQRQQVQQQQRQQVQQQQNGNFFLTKNLFFTFFNFFFRLFFVQILFQHQNQFNQWKSRKNHKPRKNLVMIGLILVEVFLVINLMNKNLISLI